MRKIMTLKYRLAQSYWPRAGYDQGNRSYVPFAGAERGKIIHQVPLPSSQKGKKNTIRGGCVMTDTMSLRVEYDNILSAISINGEILWSVKLRDTDNKRPQYRSNPVALEDGSCLVALSDSVCVYNSQGRSVSRLDIENALDDSGCAPNLTDSGQLLLAGISGEIWRVEGMEAQEIGCFGYDLFPPAIYPDNSLAVAGYCGDGFCRVHLDGKMVWKTEFNEADMLPTINQNSIAAVGSKNDDKSAFYSTEGTLIGTYARAAIFAEYSSDSWIARSNQWIAKLTVDGAECWKRPLQDETNWGQCQPIVDGQGRIFLVDDNKLLCFNGDGEILFSTEVSGDSGGGLGCVSPGKMAYLGAGTLQIIE